MNKPMELDIWKGDWGLASVDLECLRLVTLCKFAGAPIQINIKNHALNAPNGRLPVLRHYKQTCTSFDTVSNYLVAKNLSPDFGLSQEQKADILAFTMFLKEGLDSAILYVWWGDERNRIGLSRKWWAKTLPFPLGMILPDRFHKAAVASLEGVFPNMEVDQAMENEIYDRAMKCITNISLRLGSQEFLFGAHPTSIDATLYAYLAPLVKVPFPSNRLKNHIISHNNLLKYVTRISQRYFAAENQAYESQRQQESSSAPSGQLDSFPHKRRNQILATVVAVIAMAGYAVSTGLLQIPAWFWFSSKAKPSRVIQIPVRYNI